MPEENTFQPNWVSPPGETISDILKERDVSESEFAEELGRTTSNIQELLQGRLSITIDDARKLKDILGASVEFWMTRDYQYREDVVRIHSIDQSWLGELPLVDMIKFGWLTPPPLPEDELDACLQFFGVSSVKEWRNKYSSVEKLITLRTSPAYESRSASVAAWLRQGEIEAEDLNCREWDANRFRETLLNLRSLTRRKDPQVFIPALQEHCARCGVAVAIVQAPNGCRASGATAFLNKKKALLLLSFRYLTDDHFWFSFYHEAGHLVLHNQEALFLEGSNQESSRDEDDADEFAARIMIPFEFLEEMLRLRANYKEVIRFSRKIGISPGIVAGQLQYHGIIRHNQLNRLKRRFKWDGLK